MTAAIMRGFEPDYQQQRTKMLAIADHASSITAKRTRHPISLFLMLEGFSL